MKYIVTGSEGFIGRHLVSRLVADGHEVTKCDSKSGMSVGEITLDKFDGVDVVFHLAAQTSVFNTNKLSIIDDNIMQFSMLCDACYKLKIKLVYASSSTANPCNTTSLYGMSKYFDEQYASVYCPRATGVRLHNVYGPFPRQGTLLNILLENEEVRLYNMGQNIRCFTYIDDAVEGLIKAASSQRRLVNVVNYQPVSTHYFANLVRAKNGVKIALESEHRDMDNITQEVDTKISIVPLHYLSVEDGINRVFEIRSKSEKE